MPPRPPSSRQVRGRPATGGVVTLDHLTAAGHPDAVVTGILLTVIGALVLVGLTGLLGPVLSLDLFRPDLSFGDLFRSLARIGVSVIALVTAGLGLAKHPLFPRLYMAVASGLTLLMSMTLSTRLATAGLAAPIDLFFWLGLPVIIAVPYVVFSRKCQLIFHRRLDLNAIGDLKGLPAWEAPVTREAVSGPLVPAVPAEDPQRPAPPRRPRTRKSTPVANRGALDVTKPPPPGAPNAALWAALYGGPPATAAPAESGGDGGDTQVSAGKRVGLESLINLRPPGT